MTRSRRGIDSLHHVACDYPIAAANGSSIRVVITSLGVSEALLDWFLTPRNKYKSRLWQHGYAQAFGLFYDFMYQRQRFYESSERFPVAMSDFVEALLCGTVDKDSLDPTGLFWPKASFSVAEAHVKRIIALADFFVERHGAPLLSPWITANWSERIARFRAWDQRNSQSLLKHLGDRKEAWAQTAKVRSVSLPSPPKRTTCVLRIFHQASFVNLSRLASLVGPRHARDRGSITAFEIG